MFVVVVVVVVVVVYLLWCNLVRTARIA